ncbi:MAG: hypothetical protein QOE63_96 [Acidimicrobiaceae bacterium]|jgi:hypothetical protein
MTIQIGLALWLLLSVPFAVAIGAVLRGSRAVAASEVVGLDGDVVILLTADGTLERAPLTIGV